MACPIVTVQPNEPLYSHYINIVPAQPSTDILGDYVASAFPIRQHFSKPSRASLFPLDGKFEGAEAFNIYLNTAGIQLGTGLPHFVESLILIQSPAFFLIYILHKEDKTPLYF